MFCKVALFFAIYLKICLALISVPNHNPIAASDKQSQQIINDKENSLSSLKQEHMRRAMMKVRTIRASKKTYPTGNPNFAVMQAFPAGISDSDPFLMCDHFGPKRSEGVLGPDEFPVGWHPHRGMDILTYMIEGKIRHADSMGNRETCDTPGMQWISVGSGIEHAEGGGTPAGENDQGFQIWLNVPAKHKMDPPQYGTNPPEQIPHLTFTEGVTARLLAGAYQDSVGPFQTKQDVQMIDYMLAPNTEIEHTISTNHDNCLIYVYDGSGDLCDSPISKTQIAQLDCTSAERTISLRAGANGFKLIIFAGKRINEPVAWRGPFVMNTFDEIQATMDEYRRGDFPPVRVPWDYTKLSAFPAKNQEEL